MIALAPALAQEPAPVGVTTLPDPLTPAAIDAMVSRLSDSEVRALLLQQLATVSALPSETGPPPKPLAEAIAVPMQRIAERLQEAVANSPQNAVAALHAVQEYGRSLGPGGVVHLLLVLAVALVAGALGEFLLGLWSSRRGKNHISANADIPTFPASIPYLARRLFHDLAGALISLVVAALVLALMLPERETRVAMSVVLWQFFFPRIAWVVLRFFLSPNRPELRLVNADQRTAQILFRSLVAVLLVVGIIQSVRLVMVEVGAEDSALAIGFWVNLLVFLWLALIVIRCRDGLRQIVRGGNDTHSPDGKWIVGAYPAYALSAIAGTWISGLVAESLGKNDFILDGRHFLSLGLLLVVPMCDTLIRATVRLLMPPIQGSGVAAQTAFDAAYRSYVRVGRVVVFGTIILVLANLWGMSAVGLAEAGVGKQLGERVVVATLIMLAAYILIELVSLSINHRLSTIKANTQLPGLGDDEDPVLSSSRAGTILPLISWTLQAAILMIAAISALGQLGVNVTALLAGAGVAGVAIGFGAQKLVADLVSGVFFLMDDAFRINEHIAAGSIEGKVEKIALQSMHLRKSDGAIHCVLYSNVDTITNFSRDWGVSELSFTVPFDTDIEHVRKICKQIGREIFDNPEYAGALLQPFNFNGVSQVTDLGIVVRGEFMFKPELAKQSSIKREIYRRVQSEFAKEGIQFARRELHISVNSDTQKPVAPVLPEQEGAASAAAAPP
ncbi:MAG: mechanosensitive ion channel family protein [Rhodobacteraceae bacterium]|nr:mechanosensitive ion channel family protein [Paracoccaceae bacterium]